MRSALRILLLAVLLLCQVGAVASILCDCCPDETAAQCATDGCSEDCGQCACTADRPALVLPAVVLPAPVAPAPAHAACGETTPPDPRTGEILHVPRPALA